MHMHVVNREGTLADPLAGEKGEKNVEAGIPPVKRISPVC
jgi:hypothetical protein